MIDYSRCAMRETPIHESPIHESSRRDCAIAVSETRNVTDRLGQDELRALRVLADAGLVPPLARVLTSATGRNWVFPDTKASR
jgi:hypothetical protein